MNKKRVKGKILTMAVVLTTILIASCNGPSNPGWASEDYVVERDTEKLKTICGPTSDFQYINQYDGSMGVTVEFVNTHEKPVGVLESATRSKYCSGTLIGRNIFLTAAHCIDSQTTSDSVVFNYEYAADGSPMSEDRYKVTKVLEKGTNMDYAILELEGFPGDTYGWATVRDSQPSPGDLLMIIQHPAGRRKSIETGPFEKMISEFVCYTDLDAEGGSSGSGVIDMTGSLIAVHTNGACTETGGRNLGVSIAHIKTESAIITNLLGSNPTPTPTATIDPTLDTWSADATYNTGDTVIYNGINWKAKWWTKGDVPGATEWGPWENMGPVGDVSPTPTFTATPTATVTPTSTVSPTPTATVPVQITVTPSPTFTATVTPTPTLTITPEPTATPTFTATPVITPTITPTPVDETPTWTAGVYYTADDIVSYNGITYKCLQSHTAYAGWEPPYVASLWQAQ